MMTRRPDDESLPALFMGAERIGEKLLRCGNQEDAAGAKEAISRMRALRNIR